MREIACAAQMRRIDAASGVEPRELMQNAAECLLRRILACRDEYGFSASDVVIVCGTGNNGGDGYALAILLYESGIPVRVVAADRPASRDALYYFSLCGDVGVETVWSDEYDRVKSMISGADLIVDALFGIGLSRAPGEPYDELIHLINESGAFVLSVDLPSGAFGDTGFVCDGLCVRADVTSAFVMKKPAHVSLPAADYCGRVFVEDIGIPPEVVAAEKYRFFQPEPSLIGEVFAPRRADSHKGTYGTLAVFCGSPGMTGAACLCAEGAMRCGVGLEVMISSAEAVKIMQTRLDHPVFRPLERVDASAAGEIAAIGPSAVVMGCGLGSDPGTREAVAAVLESCEAPVILDADGINAIASKKEILSRRRAPTVLTPHPGEMARLLGTDVKTVQNDRAALASRFAAEHGVILVLKGSRTVTASPDGTVVFNDSGTPAMAKGGMGDVLAGMIGSLAAQGADPFTAAVCGAYLHGLAGELGEKRYSQYGLSPSDMPLLAAEVINSLTREKA